MTACLDAVQDRAEKTKKMRNAGAAWGENRVDAKAIRIAEAMVTAELQRKAAEGVPVEELDSAMLPAMNALGGPAVFGFGGAAPAAHASGGAAAAFYM